MAKQTKNPTNANKNSAFYKIDSYPLVRRDGIDIKRWRAAIRSAESRENPNWVPLIEIYNEQLLDAYLFSLMEKRICNITNTKITFIDAKGEIDKEVDGGIIKKSWFQLILTEAMNALFWGYSLIELLPGKGGIDKAVLIPRQNTIPQWECVTTQQGDSSNTIDINSTPYNNYLLLINGRTRLGLLGVAAHLAIRKKDALGDWASYNQRFGSPIIVAKYNAYDPQTRQQLDRSLRELGPDGHLIVPKEADVDLGTAGGASSSSTNTYNEMRRSMNEELAVLILGQTMTTDNGSSRSQGEVHERVEERLSLADKIWMTTLLNEQLIPLLMLHGYKIAGGSFEYPETQNLTPKERLDIVLGIHNNIAAVDTHYVEKTFGVPLATTNAVKKKPNPSQLSLSIDALYSCCQSHTHLSVHEPTYLVQLAFNEQKLNELHKKAALLVQEQTNSADKKLAEELYIEVSNFLWAGAQKGWGIDFNKVDYNTPDHEHLAYVRNNVFFFSGAKNALQLVEMNALLLDDKGEPKDFNRFMQDTKPIHERFNNTWLETEYNHAIASGEMAAQWTRYQKDKQVFPYLKYSTAGDERVRESHNLLDGMVVAIDAPFWDTYYPPNGWRCRCDVTQVTASEAKKADRLMDSAKAQRHADNAEVLPKGKQRALFAKNPGKSAQWFDEQHPYFEGMGDTDMELLQHLVHGANYKYRYNNGEWDKKHFDSTSGGYVVVHKEHGRSEMADNLVVANQLAAMGEAIELLPVIQGQKTPDATRNGVAWEFKEIKGKSIKNSIQHQIQNGKQQCSRILIVIPGEYKKEELTLGIHNAIVKNDTANKRVQKIALLFADGNLVELTRADIESGAFVDKVPRSGK